VRHGMEIILGCSVLLCLAAGCAGPAPRATAVAPVVSLPPAGHATGGAAWASGSQTKDNQRRSALAAGSAALSADTVGYYVDVQEARLREQLAGSGAEVARVGDDLRVSLPGADMFATDRAELESRSNATLNSICAVLQKFDKTLIEIAGYSDSDGSAEHKRMLSEGRATAVANYLQGRGIVRARVATVGMGDLQPVASNATAHGRARNRRVELILSPLLKSG